MPLSKKDLTNGDIYFETKGTLADRIDFAWVAYQDKANKKAERKAALKFLIYAFDISNPKNVNAQLMQLMADRDQYKNINPEYIPGKSPSRIPFNPGNVVPKKTLTHGRVDSYILQKAIKDKELLDVTDESKRLDIERNTEFLTPEQRGERRVHIRAGKFKQHGINFDTSRMSAHGKEGYAAFTLNANGELSVFTHTGMTEDRFAHSSMNAGSPVVAAGEIKIVNGVLKAMNTHSGHYQPSLFNVGRTLEHFVANGVDISQANVVTFENPSSSLRTVRSNPVYSPAYDKNVYETPASQIYSAVEQLIDENISAINKQVTDYKAGGFRTSVFHLKDKLTGSTLTQDRANLADELSKKVNRFKEGLQHVTPEALPAKMEELDRLIKTYQGKNDALSTAAHKNPTSGRLASTMEGFKSKLIELKAQAEEAADKSPTNMKKIR